MKIKNKSKTLQKMQSSLLLKSLVFFSCFLLASFTVIHAQTKTITGTVTDEQSEPLTGVSISLVGTTTGTITDIDGKFSIEGSVGQELQFSFLGMKTQRAVIGAASVIDIRMEEDITMLEETVVIGYGTARKRDLTGSITTIDASQIANRPSSNPVASLQGKVSGVQVVNSGRAGQDPEIRIRGVNSINGYKPLYVVDGLFSDNINYLNPADIESMEILKDPSSLAIFGVRGANGVIIISTKRAKEGQTIVNINSSVGFKHISDKVELTNAAQFKELYDEQLKNQLGDKYVPYDYTNWQADTDWQDQIFQTGFMTNNNISITGASEKNKFYLGVGYTSEEGSIKSEKFSRLTVNLNSEYSVFDFLRFGYQVNGSRTLPPDAKQVSSALKAAPIAPVYGTYTDPKTGQSVTENYMMPGFQRTQVYNPMVQIDQQGRHNKAVNYRASGNIYGDVDFLKNFNFKATFSLDYANEDSRQFTPTLYMYNPDTGVIDRMTDNEVIEQTKITSLVAQQDYILTYRNNFENHGITATAGFTTNYREYSLLRGGRRQYIEDATFPIPNDPDKWWISSLGEENMTNKGEQWRRATVSYLLRALYNYNNRYLFNASYRRDGSSAFKGTGNEWENFYSFGAGWLVSEEQFMQSQNVINHFKVKGSWGVLGSENIGTNLQFLYPSYPFLSTSGSAVFGDNILTGYGTDYFVQNLKWEKTHSWEVGFEMNMLNNRLKFEPIYYNKVTKDIIDLPEKQVGVQNSLQNIGEVKNDGFEFAASWSDKVGETGFTYSLGANFTTINNRVNEVGGTQKIVDNISRTIAGLPIGHFYGYVVEGVYQNNEHIKQSEPNKFNPRPGDLKFKDVDGSGEIDENDRTKIGNPTPDFTYGFNINFGYKGFDLSIDMMGVYGNEIYRNWDANQYAQFNYLTDRMDRWNGEGTSNWEPILNPERALNMYPSNYYIEDGSFFRIKNIQLGYTFSPELLRKIYLKSLRIYGNIENLKTWSRNSSYSPEFGGSALSFGIDKGADSAYPMPAIYTFGLNITF